jgi:hypothetical protein
MKFLQVIQQCGKKKKEKMPLSLKKQSCGVVSTSIKKKGI